LCQRVHCFINIATDCDRNKILRNCRQSTKNDSMSRFSAKINFNHRFCFFKKGRVYFSLFLFLKSFIDGLKINVTWMVLLAFFSVLVSSSCSVFKFSSSLNRQWSNPEEILREYSANYNKLNTFRAEGRLSVQSSEFNENGTIHVSVKMPDSLRVRVEGPLGVDVANFFLDSNKYLLYLNRDEVVYEGRSDTLNIGILLKDLLGVAIDDSKINFQDIQKELIGMFIGAVFIDNLNLQPINFEDSTKTVNLFKMLDLSGEILYEFPINNELLQNVLIFDDNNIGRMEKSFSRYLKKNDVFIPRRIVYIFEEEKSKISSHLFQYTGKQVDQIRGISHQYSSRATRWQKLRKKISQKKMSVMYRGVL